MGAMPAYSICAHMLPVGHTEIPCISSILCDVPNHHMAHAALNIIHIATCKGEL